mgnify:CR=1 FL=1
MIKIICVGKIKEKFYREAILEFQKRLSKYTKLEIIEVEDVKGDNPNWIMKKEKDLILKKISDKDYIITLEIEGKELTSNQFAEYLDRTFLNQSTITFIIGGSYGLDQEIKDKAQFKLSFSRMTFPHQLFRILLLEQIYRSYKILHNESYHK